LNARLESAKSTMEARLADGELTFCSHDLVVGLLIFEETVQRECERKAVLRVKPRAGIPLRLDSAASE
jgi:hypothetical protein